MSTSENPAVSLGEHLRGWFTGRIPGDWFSEVPEVTLDREEVTVIGALPGPQTPAGAADAASSGIREETRQLRIEIAREAEHKFGRKVSWGVICEGRKVMFTTFSVPVMTRLRQPERLDRQTTRL